MKIVQVEICDIESDVRIIKTHRTEEFEYTKETTFKELLHYLNMSDVCTDNINAIIHINQNKDTNLYLKYIVHDGKFEWHYPLFQCTIQEYLETYSLDRIVLFEPKEIGGIFLPEVDWQIFFQMIQTGFTYLGYGLATYEAAKIIEELKEKYILHREIPVSLNTVQKAIKSKNIWSLNEFIYLFSMETGDTAKMLLSCAGYIYNEDNDLYFYNKTLEEKNKKKFNELSKEVFSQKDIEEILRTVRSVDRTKR